jgi:hypothetical protein
VTRVRALHLALWAALAVLAAACTTNETGSIQLAASAGPKPPKPPKPPMPPMPEMPCSADMECPKPMSHCKLSAGVCVECLKDPDCPDPRKPHCEVDGGMCVECPSRSPDSGCPKDDKCGPDPMCRPMP